MVVNIRFGGLSNRLALLAHVTATAIEEGLDLKITEFDDLRNDYACQVIWNGKVVIRRSAFWSMEKKIYGLLRRVLGDKLAQMLSLRLGIISFWMYRDPVAVEKHHAKIVAFLTPRLECIENAKTFESVNYLADKVVVGVHIRRGDYRQWKGGVYYYPDEVYWTVMQSLQRQILMAKKPGKHSVRFVVFSDEPVRLEHFPNDLEVVCSKGTAIEDHYLMSKCDLLVGPPSTFTFWASYIGKVPLCHIRNLEHRPLLSEFKWNVGC